MHIIKAHARAHAVYVWCCVYAFECCGMRVSMCMRMSACTFACVRACTSACFCARE